MAGSGIPTAECIHLSEVSVHKCWFALFPFLYVECSPCDTWYACIANFTCLQMCVCNTSKQANATEVVQQ